MSEILDSRDLQERLEELESRYEDYMDETNEGELHSDQWDLCDENELNELRAFASEVPEWEWGETLIPEDEFTEYCKELCDDLGSVPWDMPSWIVIDWDATAENLKVDYGEFEFEGINYLFRNV